MSTIDDIKSAIQRLSREELAAFRAWFVEYDACIWDEQIAADVSAGRLEALADEAIGIDLATPRLIDELKARSADPNGAIEWRQLRDTL